MIERLVGTRFRRQWVSAEPGGWRFAALVVAVALTSRIALAVLFLLGHHLTALHPTADLAANVSLYSEQNLNALLASATTYGDFNWYNDIVQHGYAMRPFSSDLKANWAFFPLQPVLISLIHQQWQMFAWGMGTFILAMVFFGQFCAAYLSRNAAIVAVSLAAFSPASFVLSQFRPDAALFCALSGALLFASRRNLAASIAMLVIAGFAKPNGCLAMLLVAPFFLIGPDGEAMPVRGRLGHLAAIAIAGLAGVVTMSLVCLHNSGDPLAWQKIQLAWGNIPVSRFVEQFYALLVNPRLVGRFGWDFELFNWAMLAVAVFSIRNLFRMRATFMALFSLAYLLMTVWGFGVWLLVKHLAASPAFAFGIADSKDRQASLLPIAILVIFAVLFGAVCVMLGANTSPTMV